MKLPKFTAIILIAAVTQFVFAQGNYSTVETKDLLDQPQRYWATSVVFKDSIVEAPTKKTVKIQGKKYHELLTQELGEVYIPKMLFADVEQMPPGREYLFSGTVLNKGGFIGKETYYFVIEDVVEQLNESDDIEESVADMVGAETADSLTPVKRVLGKLLFDSQASILVFAKQNELEPAEIFNPDSEAHEKLTELLGANVRPLEREGEMSPTDIVSALLKQALMEYYEQTPPELLTSAQGFVKAEEEIASAEEGLLDDNAEEVMMETTEAEAEKPKSEEEQTLDQLFSEEAEELAEQPIEIAEQPEELAEMSGENEVSEAEQADNIVLTDLPLQGSVLENLKQDSADSAPSPFSIPHPIHF